MDPGEVWDQVLESARTLASTPASASFGLVKLKLTRHRRIHHRENIHRSVDEIDGVLREAIRALVAAKSPWPLFLWGSAGTGKTCAALALLDHVEGQTEYRTATEFNQLLIDCTAGRIDFENPAVSAKLSAIDVWRRARSVALYVIDEIGCRDRVSDFAYDNLKDLIDKRKNKPLVVISNHGLEMIAKLYDDRLASRLSEGTVVELTGRDRRVRK